MKNLITSICSFLILSTAMAQVDRSKMPEAGPAPKIELGETESFTLDNGLKVFVVENNKLPRVSFNLVLDFKPFTEGGKTGSADLAGDLLMKGTKSRSAEVLNQEVDFIGARLNTSASSVYATSLKRHQGKILELMADVVKNPNFTQEELDKLKKQYISNIASTVDDPDAIASNVRRAIVYGKQHPYGEIMTEESINNIELKDVQEFYNTYFKPNISYLAVVGDVNLKEIKPLIKKYFADWKKGEVPAPSYEDPKKPVNPQIVFVNKPGAVQSVISVTYPIEMKNASEDKIKANVMNTILGGGFTSRLNMNLREKNAYTYGARSSLSADELVGYFEASAKVRNEVTDSAIYETLKEMQGMLSGNITDEELTTIKNYSTGIFAYQLENPQTKANFAINTERYDLPDDYYENYLKELNEVDKEDIMEMAKKYITPGNAYILVVGNKEEVADKLTKFSSNEILYLDAYGNEVSDDIKAVPKGLTAEKVIDNYIEALGGEKSLKKIKSFHKQMSASMQGMSMNLDTYTQSPNKLSQKVSAGEMIVEHKVFDGEKGKISGMGGNKEMGEEEVKKAKFESILFPELQYDELGYKTELKGIKSLNDEEVYIVELETPIGDKQTDYYSLESALLVKSESVEDSPMGPITQEMMLSDYKEVEGVKFPYTIKQKFGPQSMEMKVEKIEINPNIPEGTFIVE